MPTDCEMNWREHRPCIKGRTIFGMILKSSSKHDPFNMKTLLIALTCLATCLAAPEGKQKRGILPGDPRYGTDHHHHHDTVLETVKSIGGYGYNIPDSSLLLPQGIPQDYYGPPNYQPGLPLNNDYLAPVIDSLRHSTPLPTIATPQVTKTVISPAVGLKQTVTSTPLPLPLEKVQTVTASPLTTSYGTPVIEHFKTVGSIGPALKTVRTEIHGQAALDLPRRVVKVSEHAPLLQEVTQVTGIKSLPSLSTISRTVGGPIGTYPTLGTSSALLTNDHATLNGIHHAGLAGLKSVRVEGPLGSIQGLRTINGDAGLSSIHGLKSVHVEAPLASIQLSKNIHSLPLTNELPKARLHGLEAVTHIVNRIPPSIKTVATVTPIPPHAHTNVRTFEHVPPLHHTGPALTSIKSVGTLPALTQPVHPLPAIKTLDTLSSFRSAYPIHTAPAVTAIKSVETIQPAVETIVHPLPTVHPSIQSIHPLPSVAHVETVGTLTPAINTAEVLPSVHPAHTITEVVKTKTTPVIQKNVQVQIQRGPISDFISGIGSSLPSLPSSLPSLPQLPLLPSFPQFPSIANGVTTVRPIEVSTPSSVLADSNLDSITVDNPLIREDTFHGNIHNGYIQPTDKNGGYIY